MYNNIGILVYYTHVALAAQPFEEIVRLELVLLVGHDARHFEREPGLGHLVFEQPLAHGVERRRHHVARGHGPEIVHHQHDGGETVWRVVLLARDNVTRIRVLFAATLSRRTRLAPPAAWPPTSRIGSRGQRDDILYITIRAPKAVSSDTTRRTSGRPRVVRDELPWGRGGGHDGRCRPVVGYERALTSATARDGCVDHGYRTTVSATGRTLCARRRGRRPGLYPGRERSPIFFPPPAARTNRAPPRACPPVAVATSR